MACDPRQKLGAQQRKSNFFRTVGKVGDIEALNSADSNIGQGLRALETISNQLRTGSGPVAQIWKDTEASIETGADAVLSTVGIDPNAARDVGSRFNPGVLNRAQGQAQAIYERVRQGNFEIRDVPEAIQDFGNLGQLLGGVFTPRKEEQQDIFDERKICEPSPWAMDLFKYAPKNKFMFVVQFTFSENYKDEFEDLEFAFVIKRTTRPQIALEYEDLNYYNFRTKVLKHLQYQPMQMTFYDDQLSNALNFYNNYLQIISPVSRGNGARNLMEESGMTFDQTPGGLNSASTNAVGNQTKTILQNIIVYHLINYGQQVDVYSFDNPRIQQLQLDELDMTDGGGQTEVVVEFNYDRVFLEVAADINSENYRDQITDSSNAGKWAITFANLPETGGVNKGDSLTADYSESTGGGSAPLTNEQAAAQQQRDALNEEKANSQNRLLSANDVIRQGAEEANTEAAQEAADNFQENLTNTVVVPPPTITPPDG